jgi:hypothetical protein
VSDPIKRWKINRSGWMEGCASGSLVMYDDHVKALEAANARITTLLQDIEDLKHDNASMLDSLTKESVARCEAEDKLEIATQELKNIANADTIAWDDPTEYEAWAKSRARWALGKVGKEKS